MNESAILGLTLMNVSLLDQHEATNVLSSDHSLNEFVCKKLIGRVVV